ncbi:hypothetical protein, partial [Francisella tularensis]
MAFLLDIITFLQISFSTNIFFYKYLFLQISFSTNIFRINYKNQSNILHLIEARKNKTSTFAFMLTQ